MTSCPDGIEAAAGAAARGPATGCIFDIKRFSSHDGPGIRSTVFFRGCPLRCAWCHNPEALLTGPSAVGKFREIGALDLIRELERDLTYFDASGGGVTFSGGEPLSQVEFLCELLGYCRQRDLHSAVDTSGRADPSSLLRVASLTDLILYDLKAMDSAVHHQWTGSGNEPILENLKMLDTLQVEVWIRFPLIPGVNDDDDQLDALVDCLDPTRFRQISILPYHRIGESKNERLNLPSRMNGIQAPSAAAIERVRARLTRGGLHVCVGR